MCLCQLFSCSRRLHRRSIDQLWQRLTKYRPLIMETVSSKDVCYRLLQDVVLSCFVRVVPPVVPRDLWTCKRRSNCYEWSDGNNVFEWMALALCLSADRRGNMMVFSSLEIRYPVSWTSIWCDLLLIVLYLQHLATLSRSLFQSCLQGPRVCGFSGNFTN